MAASIVAQAVLLRSGVVLNVRVASRYRPVCVVPFLGECHMVDPQDPLPRVQHLGASANVDPSSLKCVDPLIGHTDENR